jgi:hypothetical protein
MILLVVLVATTLANSCKKNESSESNQDAVTKPSGAYLGSEYKGNFVWAGAMNLAWNELNDNILKEKLQLNTTDAAALKMVGELNNPVFTKNDLDEKSYYIKSGYGQKTVEVINKESKEKFPNKSLKDLILTLSETDIISYAYFLKETEYKQIFEKAATKFEDTEVEGFAATKDEQRNNVRILNYNSDDTFLISLLLKDADDQLFLAKGYPDDGLKTVMEDINQKANTELAALDGNDSFTCPVIDLSHSRDYKELINKHLLNKGFEEYMILKMFENIKFNMDEKGARVENEAVIVIGKSVPQFGEPRQFVLDKPFWVIMKRKNAQVPFFILHVKNVELMKIKK